MTWYDGRPAPDPHPGDAARVAPDPRPDDAALAAVGAGRARLRAAARAASEADPVPHDGARAPATDRGSDAASGAVAPGPQRASVASPPEDHDLPPGGTDGEREPFGSAGDDEAVGGERPRLADLVRWRLAPRTAVIALGALLLVGGAVVVRSAAQPGGEPVTVEEPVVTTTATTGAAEQAATAPAEEATVWVHVVGRVAAPGVVALPAGSRVGDAVGAAGGPLPDADLAALNLAAVVQDGAQVRVPAPGEEPVTADDADGTAGSSGGGAVGPAGGGVDVNTAASTELQTLPGIGPVLAERIVAWREANGPFGSVDALLDVSGIGPAVLGQIRDLVRV